MSTRRRPALTVTPPAEDDHVLNPPPLGFPRCWHCALRLLDHPEVCRRCLLAATAEDTRVWYCPVCGQGTAGGACPNRWCGRADRAFVTVYAAADYSDGLRQALHRYKFGGQRWWADVFARILAGELRAHPLWYEEYDLLVGMPAYTGSGGRRRWDPVGAVLAAVARLAPEWQVAPSVVAKAAETPRLSGRSRLQRERIAERDLRPALRLRTAVDGARVLVVDDLFTEGSSLQEVARLLRHGGAEEVAALVLARPLWRGSGSEPAQGGDGRRQAGL